jgi:hypothetical protein
MIDVVERCTTCDNLSKQPNQHIIIKKWRTRDRQVNRRFHEVLLGCVISQVLSGVFAQPAGGLIGGWETEQA